MSKPSFGPLEIQIPTIDPAVASAFCCSHLGFVPGLQNAEDDPVVRKTVILYGAQPSERQQVTFFKFGIGAKNASVLLVLQTTPKKWADREEVIKYLVQNGAIPVVTSPAPCAQDFAIFHIPGGVELKVNFNRPEPLRT
ncbi:MAG: hypothetical protein V4664_02955 [Patescibacteria group bacterium]